MGNDGGTIAKRKDILSLYENDKQTAVKGDDSDRALLVTCAISSLPLYTKDKKAAAVVGDYKGNLYLKEKILEYLIQKKTCRYPEEKSARWNHIKSTKDLVDVTIAWSTDTDGGATIKCPVTEETQLHSYAYLRPCGCLMSYKVIQEMGRDLKASNQKPVQSNCPNCNTEFHYNYDIVILNPSNSEATAKFNLENYQFIEQMGLTHSKRRRKSSDKKSLDKSNSLDKPAKKQKLK